MAHGGCACAQWTLNPTVTVCIVDQTGVQCYHRLRYATERSGGIWKGISLVLPRLVVPWPYSLDAKQRGPEPSADSDYEMDCLCKAQSTTCLLGSLVRSANIFNNKSYLPGNIIPANRLGQDCFLKEEAACVLQFLIVKLETNIITSKPLI